MKRRERKGATIVVVTLLLTVLLAMMAVAIDLSRMYVGRAELQTAADATAHMGAVQLARGWNVESRMSVFAPRNVALGAPMSGSPDSTEVHTGYWIPATRTFQITAPSPAPPGVNAVRAITKRSTRWTFGGALGLQFTPVINDTAVAFVGSLTTGTCVKPWSMPFGLVTRLLPGSPAPAGYTLSQSDVNYLANLPSLPPTGGSSSPGSRTIIAAPPSNGNGQTPKAPPAPFTTNWDGLSIPSAPNNGTSGYQAVMRDASCQYPVSVNDVLDKPGNNLDTKTSEAITPSVCTFSSTSDICYQADGRTPGVKVKVTFGLPTTSNGREQVVVKMLGEFTVMCYARAANNGGGGGNGNGNGGNGAGGGQGLRACPVAYMPVPVPTSTPTEYSEGTIVGYFAPDFNLSFSGGDVLGTTPSIAQKIILVR